MHAAILRIQEGRVQFLLAKDHVGVPIGGEPVELELMQVGEVVGVARSFTS